MYLVIACIVASFSYFKLHVIDSRNNAEKKRKGRGITRLDEIFARKPSMPKIKVELNKYGQPIGDNCRRFSSALGCHVRRKLSVGCSDWRLVDPQKKYEVWEDMKVYHYPTLMISTLLPTYTLIGYFCMKNRKFMISMMLPSVGLWIAPEGNGRILSQH